MNRTPISTLAAAIATLWLAAPTAALAGEQDGVRCPSGATALISNGNKTLRCTKVETIDRPAVCSPVVFKGNGDVLLNTRIDQVTAGRDVCRVVGKGGAAVTAPPQFVPLPGDPAASAFQQITLPGADVFRATRTVYVYPVGGPIYNPLDDESKGVSCPSGFDGDARFGGTGIRCDKQVTTKAADCDFPYSLDEDRRGNEDRCLLANSEGGTKPVGITFVQMQAEKALPTISWTLDINDGGDRWIKKEYTFPRSSN
jgi:hypothetical protein